MCLSADAEGDVCGDTDRTHAGALLIPDTTCVEGEHDTTLCICIFVRTHTHKHTHTLSLSFSIPLRPPTSLDSISHIEVQRLSTSDTGIREECQQTSLVWKRMN